MNNLNFSAGSIEICNTLIEAGFEAAIVGGATRDAWYGLTPHDEDIATSATPDQVRSVFGEERVRSEPRGESHGKVLVSTPRRLNWVKWYEVTMFRKDVATDGRHAHIAPGTLQDDLARRDFTVNALAYVPPKTGIAGRLITAGDHTLKDLHNKVIRFQGDPDTRIREDVLRIARAPRMRVLIEGKYEDQTQRALMWAAAFPNLWPGILSWERIGDELLKSLRHPRAWQIMDDWQHLGLFFRTIPALYLAAHQPQNEHHGGLTVFQHIIEVLKMSQDVLPESSLIDPGVYRLALLLHDAGKPAVAELKEDGVNYRFHKHEDVGEGIAAEACRALKLPNSTTEMVSFIVREHMDVPNENFTDKATRRWIRRVGLDKVGILVLVRNADWLANGRTERIPQLEAAMVQIKAILTESPPVKLAVNGDDVMAVLNIKPSKRVGEVLKVVEEIVDTHPDLNDRELLLRIVGLLK